MSTDLPSGWEVVPLKDLVEPRGERISPQSIPDAPFIGMEHVEPHTNRILNTVPASTMASSAARFYQGDVLYGRMRPYLNKVVSPSFDGLASAEFIVFPKSETVDSRFLLWRLSSSDFTEFACSQYEGDRPRVKFDQLGNFKVLLPPVAEQARIVEQLEEMLSDLEAGVTELKAAQVKLGQYRQSLLRAAVEGLLTADWRATRGQPQETGAELLQRILFERRARWEQKQLAKFVKQGKEPPKGWQAKYPEPAAPDLTDLPPLPKTWTWASLDQLSEIQGGIQKQPSRAPIVNRYPFLRVANISRGELKLDEIHEIELFDGELERLALQKGDILIVEGNGSRTEIGRCALWDGSIENAVHQNHLIRARPLLAQGEFIEAWLNSVRGIERMTALAATTSGLYTLSVGKISRIPVPLPPLEEQDAITDALTIALTANAEQASATNHSLGQAAAQRKNILKAAFTGKLIPQDSNDEPASALLARIRSEREAREKPQKVRMGTHKEIADVVRRMIDVLAEAHDWIPAQEVFRRCGVANGASTDQIEALYAELRALDKAGRVEVEAVTDAQGRKLGDKLKLRAG